MELLKNMTVLTDDDIYKIHKDVMEVLWQIGIMVEDVESLKLLEKHGAKIDLEKNRAYLPPELVKYALDVKCDSWSFYDAYGNRTINYGGKDMYYATCGYSTNYVDRDGVNRVGTYDALSRVGRYCEMIDEIDMVQPSIQPCDIDADIQDLYMAKCLLVTTRKPIHTIAFSEKNTECVIKMVAEVSGGIENLKKKPRLLLNVCTFSPLGIRKDACEVIKQAAKYRVPLEFSTGTMSGATSPVTIAGSIVEAFAEVIGHIVLTQCYQPGMPCSMLSANRIFDMKFAACTVATPEYAVIKVAACQMAQFYKIPIGVIGPCSDSNDFDVQLGWEKFMSAFVSRQAGANMGFAVGLYSQLNNFAYVNLALDAELIRNIEKIGKGMDVNEYTLAYDVLEQEGETGNFLYNDHTINNYRSEFLTPILTDRAPYATFEKRQGKNNLLDRAWKQLDKLDKAYNYTLGAEHEEALQKIIDEYVK